MLSIVMFARKQVPETPMGGRVTLGMTRNGYNHTTMSACICGCNLPFIANAIKERFNHRCTQMAPDPATHPESRSTRILDVM
jgi:hypothetical protein